MNQTKFTPGPWYLPDKRDMIVECQSEGGYNLTVADCGRSFSLDDETMKANARLIAKAPEMFEALKRIRNNAQARKWNSASTDRADVEAFTEIERTAQSLLNAIQDGEK